MNNDNGAFIEMPYQIEAMQSYTFTKPINDNSKCSKPNQNFKIRKS